jgi:hypothetical protein
MAVKYSTVIQKFDKKGEKTGWSYIEITAAQAAKLKPGQKVSFRVKGTLDEHAFEKVALLPMGDGNFIMPLNQTMRKAIAKGHGDKLKVTLEVDERTLQLSGDLMACLAEDPEAMKFFKSLPKSHQQYFSKWIEGAKTAATKTRRIVAAMTAFGKKQRYSEMMRTYKHNAF